jgi:hypothetical protein
VRARLDWRTRRGGSETRMALADIAATIVSRSAGLFVLGIVGLALAIPGVAQASPKPDPAPQAAPTHSGGPSPDPAPTARSSSSSGSSVSAPSTPGPTVGSSSSSSSSQSTGSSSATGTPIVVQPSISGAAVAEPTAPADASTGSSTTARTGRLKTIPLRRETHTTARPARHHTALPGVGIQLSFWRHFFPLPGLAVLNARLPASPSDGLLLLVGAGAFFVLAAASGSLLRMLTRAGSRPQGQ